MTNANRKTELTHEPASAPAPARETMTEGDCFYCGTEGERPRGPGPSGAWWDPDDGWRWAPLCDDEWCARMARRLPHPTDYAYHLLQEPDVDTAIYDTEGAL